MFIKLSLLLLCFLAIKSRAQIIQTVEEKLTHFSISVQPSGGFVYAHDVPVMNVKGTMISGFEIKFNRERQDAEARRYNKKYFNTGFSLGFFHFSKKFLGDAVVGAYFIEPYLIHNKKFSLSPQAAIGLSYNSNPHNDVSNSENQSYSLYFNPYLSLGVNIALKISEKYSIESTIRFNHLSNGAIYHPNRGLNFQTVSAGVKYDLNIWKTVEIVPPSEFKWRYDITPFGTWKSIPSDAKRFHALYGLSIQANRKVGWFHALNMGVESLDDLGMKKKFEIEGKSELNSWRIGILAGHEFLFRKFNFSQQLGVNVFNEISAIGRLYHRWGLYYRIAPGWMVGSNFSAHKLKANFLDFRAIYSIYK